MVVRGSRLGGGPGRQEMLGGDVPLLGGSEPQGCGAVGLDLCLIWVWRALAIWCIPWCSSSR